MKTVNACHLVLMTTPDLQTARRLARAALTARLVACANLIPQVESHYWWQGRIARSREVLVVFKTSRPRRAALEKLMLAEHPYDTPEFLVLSPTAGNRRFLDWILASCQPAA